MIILDGKKLREGILEDVKTGVARLPFVPVFCDVLVGGDPASAQYVRMKAKLATSAGIKFHNAHFADDISTENLVAEIKKLNILPHMCGLIVQLPLPGHLDVRAVLDAVSPDIDVDCLSTETSNRFYAGEVVPAFPTALACMEILDSLKLDLLDKKIVVVGQGMLVGRPVTHLLLVRGLNVETVTRTTENKEEIIKNADIIISGTGHAKLIVGGMVKKGVVIIDAGTSESKGGIVGDVDLESVESVAGYVSPVPGGVGPVTVAMLLKNVLTVARSRAS
ncbi:MAG: bifunctional 5,10-methylenetetrahydrofolate dehydrogenase/5,10-methenyltetrahydrofolate cyclohydrolase [Patescibacteria group bacterium]